MLKYMRTYKNNTHGLYGIYGSFKIGSERIMVIDMSKLTGGYLLDYTIPESDELKTYIKYFAQTNGYDYGSTINYIKLLPIKRRNDA